MLDIKQFTVFLKEKFNDLVDTFYIEIDEDFKTLYPVLVFEYEYEIVNENRIIGEITANLYDNKFNNILDLEQLCQDIYNNFNYFRKYVSKNGVDFSVMISNVRIQNAPTEQKDIKRKLITINFETQFK